MKTAKQNFANLLKNKSVLFLENDNGLYHGLDQLEEILIKEKIKYDCIFGVGEKPLSETIEKIMQADCIIFQTQWVYKIAGQISDFMFSLKEKKIVIECYISKPTWCYKPKAVHDVYIIKPPYKYFDDPVDESEFKFYKLSNKPYWNYKNEFNL